MGWRIVEVNTDEHIQLYLNNLMIKRSIGKILINISDIDTLILNNYRTSITIRLINALSKNNVNIIIMDSIHEPCSYIIPVNGNHNSLKILEKQINWNNKYKGFVWKQIIKNKIYNQNYHLVLQGIKNYENYFNQLANEIRSFDITNREGHAAKVYWNLLFGKKFIRDQKSIKFPIINGMLNYGYAILRSLVIKSIIKKGLDPRISLFHKTFTNFFALASDLMEPYRPMVDKIIFNNKTTDTFNFKIKDQLIGILEKQVILDGKKEFINNAIDKQVDYLINGKGWKWLELWD